MKLKTIFVLAAMLAIGVSSSFGAIGWAGNIWPCSGSTHLPTDDINVYVQVYKDGCTQGAGQCADLSAELYFKKASDATYTMVPMTYNGEVGNNDEFTGTIPFTATQGGENMDVYTVIYDASDASSADWAGDQCSNGPPLSYVIEEGTTNEVTVTFRVDMSCIDSTWFAGGVHFVGSHTGWGMCAAGTEMADPDMDGIWEGDFVFPRGSTTNWDYKFQRNDGLDCYWMDGGNYGLVLDDSSPTQILDIIPWVQNPSGPNEISGPGSYCVTLDCFSELWILLNTPYDPPTIANIDVTGGCHPDFTNCDDPSCVQGFGTVVWDIRQGGDMNYYLVMHIEGEDAQFGCFCITIDAILPVELSNFDAVAGDNEVTLNWTTASEVGNDYFSIVRDGSEITRVDAHGGATGSEYIWVDGDVSNGHTYEYTLINVDVDGSRSTLETASVTPNRGNANVMEYTLHQNYPNPFNPSTSIAYSLESAGLVNITVFDVTGREVATLVNGVMAAGSHSVEFDAAGLPSGIYMYRMEAGDFSAVQKMVLMK